MALKLAHYNRSVLKTVSNDKGQMAVLPNDLISIVFVGWGSQAAWYKYSHPKGEKFNEALFNFTLISNQFT